MYEASPQAISGNVTRPMIEDRLPSELRVLIQIALNLRWSWEDRSQDLFRAIDPALWESSRHNPMAVLLGAGPERFAEISSDAAFMELLAEIQGGLKGYLEATTWFKRQGKKLQSVAYFSPEFGLTEALPQYSGGLGILAGDHLKAASGLGIPITGVGLFYREGYFQQQLTPDGWQEENYAVLQPEAMALSPIDRTDIHVNLDGHQVPIRIFGAAVGRGRLLLLDAGTGEHPEALKVTDRLYGGDHEHRLRQEIVLGIGGVRALAAAGMLPQVFHMNEGHAGFLIFERIRMLISDGKSFEEAVEAVRATTAFTTHTSVPAAIDRFPRDLMWRYFGSWAEEAGISLDPFLELGREPDAGHDGVFNMAMMCLRVAGRSNGVSELHAGVSRSMFHPLWPDKDTRDVPIMGITNGVHARTWVSSGMTELFDRYVLPIWSEAGPQEWANLRDATDEELWRIREHGRENLVALVRSRGRAVFPQSQDGAGGPHPEGGELLDPHALTVGFARRFTEYKRPTLLMSQRERLKALLSDDTRPLQLVIAGKAHPADHPGKEMIKRIVEFSHDPEISRRVVFLADYDMDIAKTIYQGVDVWLNNPRRPLEACGTSGMKAALNGALNFSTADGWWNEMFNGDNGWSIPSAEHEPHDRRDQIEADALYEILESEIIPLFYDRPNGSAPKGWVGKMKDSLISLGPRVGASRMLRDYLDLLYEPLALASERLGASEETAATG
ncbi:MAG: alpha-glucan family phosphorylase [Actinomycetota bacterium]